jgi:hypothetical protein
MKSSRSKSNCKPVSNGPEFPALLFTKVGMILAMGDYTTTFGLEFPEPINQQEMFAYMDKTVPAQLTILGFVAFTTDNLGVVNIMDDLCDAEDFVSPYIEQVAWVVTPSPDSRPLPAELSGGQSHNYSGTATCDPACVRPYVAILFDNAP